MYVANPEGRIAASLERFHVKPNRAIQGRRALSLDCAVPAPLTGPTQFVSHNSPQSYPQEYPPRYPPGMRGTEATTDPLGGPWSFDPEPTLLLFRRQLDATDTYGHPQIRTVLRAIHDGALDESAIQRPQTNRTAEGHVMGHPAAPRMWLAIRCGDLSRRKPFPMRSHAGDANSKTQIGGGIHGRALGNVHDGRSTVGRRMHAGRGGER